MKRALAGLLICAALALLAFWIWRPWEPGGPGKGVKQAARPDMCEIGRFCVARAPPPVDLRLGEAALGPDHPDYSAVLAAIGAAGRGTIHPYDPAPGAVPELPDQAYAGRLYLVRLDVGGEALVIVRNVGPRRHALVVRRAANFSAYHLRTDAHLYLHRFALVDPATGVGDSFELRQPRPDKMFSYVALAPDSPEIRAQWFESQRSTCGDGPLTTPRPEWVQEYQRVCGP